MLFWWETLNLKPLQPLITQLIIYVSLTTIKWLHTFQDGINTALYAWIIVNHCCVVMVRLCIHGFRRFPVSNMMKQFWNWRLGRHCHYQKNFPWLIKHCKSTKRKGIFQLIHHIYVRNKQLSLLYSEEGVNYKCQRKNTELLFGNKLDK